MIRKTLFVATVFMVAIAAGCKSTPPPSATFKSYFEAQKRKDVAAMKQSLSRTSLIIMERSAKAQQVTIDKMIENQLNNPAAKIDQMPETRNQKITGDSATIELRNEEANRWDTMYFTKEDGAWKIALDRTMEEMLRKSGT